MGEPKLLVHQKSFKSRPVTHALGHCLPSPLPSLSLRASSICPSCFIQICDFSPPRFTDIPSHQIVAGSHLPQRIFSTSASPSWTVLAERSEREREPCCFIVLISTFWDGIEVLGWTGFHLFPCQRVAVIDLTSCRVGDSLLGLPPGTASGVLRPSTFRRLVSLSISYKAVFEHQPASSS